MPTYEYRCKSCTSQFDVWQKMTDDPLTTCPTCGGPVRRVLFPAGIVFKGGGFYSTDHRASGSAAAESAEPANIASGDAKPAETKSESKTAAESKPATESKTTANTKTAATA